MVILDECLPIVNDKSIFSDEAEVMHINDLKLNGKSDKTILQKVIDKANERRSGQIIFLTRDVGFKEDSGYNNLKKPPANLTVIILQNRKPFGTRIRLGSASRAELTRIVLVLVGSFSNITTA